jgi:urease accessory protein
MQPQSLTALLQLSSPSLPIGGYSYSQGFEAAVDMRVVHDETSACQWIQQQLEWVIAQCEAPVWALLFDGWNNKDWAALTHWNQWFHASRETQEIRQETEQMGWSLAKLSTDLAWGDAVARGYLLGLTVTTLPTAHAYTVHAMGINKHAGLAAYLFSWLENQTMAAIKTVPLGQMGGQRILNRIREHIPGVCDDALARASCQPPRVSTLSPQFAILSSRHEFQYSRLFRS